MSNATRLRRRLVEHLLAEGVLHDARWMTAFRSVPRHVFLPRFFVPAANGWAAVEHGDDEWLRRVYSPDVLVVQLDDDSGLWERARYLGAQPGTPTSSSSQPAIMAIMLEELRVADGHRVLEIGTGTGYNTALLCHRLGAGLVYTVDIDPELVDAARKRLAEIGYVPSCAAADGAEGFPAGVLYDRVICTCSVSSIPPAWLAQTMPGGLILTTLNRPIGGGLVRIVAGEGATGHGRVLARDGRFMPLRAHRFKQSKVPEGEVTWRPTRLPMGVITEVRSRFEFFAGLCLPGVTASRDGRSTAMVHPDGSWLRHRQAGDGFEVAEGGPRRLWEIVEAAYEEWLDLGEPGRDRFGLSLNGDEQVIWLDSPEGRTWPLSP
ncbi:methyltransferase domain-containing protein [Amycolatopsis keratiniphila]|uniref:Protein-L-isoaspartate O-methyltransferase n=1 Tax=Amycolatopsis keratiniphila TaxID=129921 RepID=R4SS67_9PSEU|nr:methyltransferase domain-containing protein [Amycolatopsis keratiniphila]AGM03031.1 protein-L-isoaspartate(D-aspartate) O-methyltransferase [Amycolatopsis keratiniphila]